MKTIFYVSAFLLAFSLNGQAQEVDYDKRNTHIFCSSHLAVVGAVLEEGSDERRAVDQLSGLHQQEARKLGATDKDFDDVASYLRTLRVNNGQKWDRLSAQSKKVCWPNS
jgi:hypothetical protein